MLRRLVIFIFTSAVPLLAEEITYNSPLVQGSAGVVKSFVKTIFFLGILLWGYYYWQTKLLPKLTMRGGGPNMQVVEKINLDYTTVVYLVQIGTVYQVYAVSNKNVSLLNTFKNTELKLKSSILKTPSFAAQFKQVLKQKKQK